MGKADLHIHSAYSPDGTATVAAILGHVARTRCVDILAITDHDVLDGALEAVELAPQYGVEVIPGVEISTADGHLLALFVTKPIAAGRPLLETIEAVADQQGICIAAHPGGWWNWCLQEKSIRAALMQPAVAKTLVGLEEYNASLPLLFANHKAAAMNQRLGLAQVCNSDAHMLWMIGQGTTHFPGHGAQALRHALVTGTTIGSYRTRPANFFPSYLWRQALRTMGWIQTSAAYPDSSITLGSITTALPRTAEAPISPINAAQPSTPRFGAVDAHSIQPHTVQSHPIYSTRA
ncbi:MAG: PHP-associated domain-containing protein [Caldilineaceae bacterium]